MHTDSLIRMANQIGTFFEAMPDRTEALEGVALHLRRFWEPRMRRELLTYVDSSGTSELNGLVADAISYHRSALS